MSDGARHCVWRSTWRMATIASPDHPWGNTRPRPHKLKRVSLRDDVAHEPGLRFPSSDSGGRPSSIEAMPQTTPFQDGVPLQMEFTCHQCKREFEQRASAARSSNGRPRKHAFCTQKCYDRWRADQHLGTKARWLRFQREVWGTTPFERHNPAGARDYGRKFELLALTAYLPREGFTDIDNLSEFSNQFFVDFVASYSGQRVLVDATVKLKAYVPEKMGLAKALRMRLFIIHIAPGRVGLYHINEVPHGRVVSRVPAAIIRDLHGDGPSHQAIT